MQRGSGHIWTCEYNDCAWEDPQGITQHSWECKDNGDGTHSKTCAWCDVPAVTEGHKLVKNADGSWGCSLCNYKESGSTGILDQAARGTKIQSSTRNVTSWSPYSERIPTVVDVLNALMGSGNSAKLVYWQGSDSEPSGS